MIRPTAAARQVPEPAVLYLWALPDTRQPAGARPGVVYLVGAGPGDPDLLTLRACELLREADVVLYDNLSSPDVLAFARPDAERRYVGKKRTERAFTQAQINGIMIHAAGEGKSVVRLKGGDPYVFGRGGEEARELFRAGIPFEVVPGVTSALGAAAYAGMPLTHRDFTQSVTMLTGHDADRIDWQGLAGRQTLVVFMGLTSVAAISRRLIEKGLNPATPAAALRWVTRGDQDVVTAPLRGLPAAVRRHGLKPPALLVIGEIVRLSREIDWFGRLPLRGESVAVTRAASQARSFSRVLRRLGAQVIPFPAIAFEPPSDWNRADRAIRRIRDYDWLIFTSANGVEWFVRRLDSSPHDLRDLPARICAIGPATAERVRSLHLRVELVPEEFVAEALVDAFREVGIRDKQVLIPRAQEARDLLPAEMARMGAQVDVVPVYRTVLPPESRDLASVHWNSDRVPGWVTATSSSTVRNLVRLVPRDLLRRTKIASIGPVTSAAARDLGLSVAAEASSYTTGGLVAAILSAVRSRQAAAVGQ